MIKNNSNSNFLRQFVNKGPEEGPCQEKSVGGCQEKSWRACLARATERINQAGACNDEGLAEDLTRLFKMKVGWVVGKWGLPRGIESEDLVQDCLLNLYKYVLGRTEFEGCGHLAGVIAKSVGQRWQAAQREGWLFAQIIEPPAPTFDSEGHEVNWFENLGSEPFGRLSPIVLREEMKRMTRLGALRPAEVSTKLAMALAECLEFQGDGAAAGKQLEELNGVDKRKLTGTENRARRSRLEEIRRDFA